jgi:hypothetical protein
MTLPVYSNAEFLAKLNAIIPVDLYPGTLKIFSNDIIPNPALDITQFTEATYDQYVPVTIANPAGSGYVNAQGEAQVNLAAFVNTMTSEATPQVVYGCYVENSGVWKLAQRFPTPVNMLAIGNTLAFVLRETYPIDLGLEML